MKSSQDIIGRMISLLLSLDVPNVDVSAVLAAWFPRGRGYTFTRNGKDVTLVGTGESRYTCDSRLLAFIERLETIHRQGQACRPTKKRKLYEHTYGPVAPSPEEYNVELVAHLRRTFSEYQRMAAIAATASKNAAIMAAAAASVASEVESTVSKLMAADTPVMMDATLSQFTLWKTEPTPMGVSIGILSSFIVIDKVRTSTVFTRQLAVGDKIICIQGTPVTQFSEEEIYNMLTSHRPLELRFSRCKP